MSHLEWLLCIKKAGVKNIPNTKIEASYNKIERMKGLDDLARIMIPGNRNHQRIFLAIFIELKYSSAQFVPSLLPLCDQYGISPRMLETVRSKMRRMGIIDHVCRFNAAMGYREGWVFSKRFSKAMVRMSEALESFTEHKDPRQREKDKDLFQYI
jgi:hypothetical protein